MRFIEEARDCHHGITSEKREPTVEDWIRHHEHFMRREAIRRGRRLEELAPFESGEVLEAIVDHGKWKVWCRHGDQQCGNPPLVWWLPEGGGIALCYRCGAIHRVEPIEDREAIERELIKRPVTWRQFEPGESAEDIRRQNRKLQVGD